MKFIKKTVAIFLALLLSIAVMPSAFAADNGVIASGEAGEGITWTLTWSGVLTVSGNGPIQDKTETEYGEDGLGETQKLDCIGWQLDSVIEELSENMIADEAIRLRYELVKELVIEEGITEIPEGEFEYTYPRSITLPSTLESIGYSAVNASFAQSLNVNSKTLELADGIVISSYQKDAEPFASLDEAFEARIESEIEQEKIGVKLNAVYNLSMIFELSNGIDNGMDPDEFLAELNETYGEDKSNTDEYIPVLISLINNDFGTSYTSIDEIFTVAKDEDEVDIVERDPELESIVNEMYSNADLGDRLATDFLGTENEESVSYQWLSVSAPSGSKAQEAAKISKVPFNPTTQEEKDDSFLGKVKAFLVKVKDFFAKVIDYVKIIISIIKSI